jgi:hypothetical protein
VFCIGCYLYNYLISCVYCCTMNRILSLTYRTLCYGSMFVWNIVNEERMTQIKYRNLFGKKKKNRSFVVHVILYLLIRTENYHTSKLLGICLCCAISDHNLPAPCDVNVDIYVNVLISIAILSEVLNLLFGISLLSVFTKISTPKYGKT